MLDRNPRAGDDFRNSMTTTLRSRFLFRFALLLTLIASAPAQAQWQKIAPPIETITVPSNGSRIPTNFTLPSGMQYWVRTSGTVIMSNGGDIADAHYYNVTPTGLGFTGFMVRAGGNDQLMQMISPQAYRADHIYVDPVTSTGSPLSFRLSDENPLKPQTDYYADNNGSLTVDVAQFTPELIIQYDTLNFGKVQIGSPASLLDSIQAYGKGALNVTKVSIQNITGGNAFTFTSERGVGFTFTETTNEFNVTAAPTVRGQIRAAMHIQTSNALGSKDRIIYLMAEAEGADIIMVRTNYTLDFGVVAAGTTNDRARPFYNQGNAASSITGVVISTPTVFSAATPVQIPAQTQQNLWFTFVPPAQGNYFATADVQYADGGSKRMYLKGRAGVGVPSLSTRLIDFGRVLIGEDSVIGLELGNVGDVQYLLESVTIDNNQFSFSGIDKNVKVGPGAKLSYWVTFKPTFHLDPYHEGRMVFKFDNGVEEVVILRGRDDSPLSALLRIDTNYYTRPGETITITQRLIGDLGLTKTPIRKFTEFIQFDKDVLELIRVEKADLVNSNDWVLASSQIGGAIDITLSTVNARLGGPGKLFNFIFRVRDNAPERSTTPITQVTPNFYNTIEPLAKVSDGIVHILGRCDPILIAGTKIDTGSFIEQNQPNPFNPTTELSYYIGREGRVTIELYNSVGERVAVLLDETRPAGTERLRIDGSSLPSGIYTYVFTANGTHEVRRMHLVK
jgi:hypothetical protein